MLGRGITLENVVSLSFLLLIFVFFLLTGVIFKMRSESHRRTLRTKK